MKIKSIFFLPLIFIFVSNAFSKDYINEQYGISFRLPDDWKIKYFEDFLPEMQQEWRRNYEFAQTLAVCGIGRPDEQNRTNVVIQYQDFKNLKLRDSIRELKSERGKKMMVSMAKLFARRVLGEDLKPYRIVKSEGSFDNDKNIAFGIVYYQNRKKSGFVAMKSKLLVEGGMATLLGWANGTEVDAFEETIGEIIDSFEFDPVARPKGVLGSIPQDIKEVGNMSKKQVLKQIWKWGGTLLTLSIIVGFVRMLLGR